MLDLKPIIVNVYRTPISFKRIHARALINITIMQWINSEENQQHSRRGSRVTIFLRGMRRGYGGGGGGGGVSPTIRGNSQ